jgi:SAM-dependent methyltransferase
MKKPWYKALFENYGKKYDSESFTQGTLGECDFVEAEASYDKTLRILDIGCGTGRHSLELARRGYNLTGIDLSASMLQQAREKAVREGLSVDFRQHDARDLPFSNEFDLAIMICEGAFPLMETDEMNYRILENAARVLNNRGKLIFTTLNGLFPLFHSVKDFLNSSIAEGNASYAENSFDLMTFRDYNKTSYEDDDGVRHEVLCNERYYVPPEITWLLKSIGFQKVDIFGARLGEFSRTHPLTTEDYEMLVIAEKQIQA